VFLCWECGVGKTCKLIVGDEDGGKLEQVWAIEVVATHYAVSHPALPCAEYSTRVVASSRVPSDGVPGAQFSSLSPGAARVHAYKNKSPQTTLSHSRFCSYTRSTSTT